MTKKTTSIKEALTGEAHKKSYSEKLKHPKWQRKRLEIMQRDDFKCKLCNDSETTLNVHHYEYGQGEPWDIEDSKLITTCEHCHSIIHEVLSELEFNQADLKIFKKINKDKDSYLFTILVNPIRYIVLISMSINGQFHYPAQVIDSDRLEIIKNMLTNE
jgi:hypothetical protein